MWHCKYWYVYLLQTMEISLDHCEMWHFFKKHVNIFIIHKTMSLTAADTILMTASMPMWPYLILLRPMKELRKKTKKTMETSTIKWRGQKAASGWTSGLFITVADENTKCIINVLFLCKWLKHTEKNHILQFHKYLLNINFHVYWCWVDSWN